MKTARALAGARQGGVGMVEFALTAPVLFILLLGMVDFSRIIQANTTVADAARQAARQAAANQVSTNQPFAARDSNPCSGTALTGAASGQGCLTDAGIKETVDTILKAGSLPSTTLFANTDAATCRSSHTPTAGSSVICISPAETGSAGTFANCSAAISSTPPGLGRQPNPSDLGARQPEWQSPKFRGCFAGQVTVLYTYQPFTVMLQQVIGNSIVVASSTTTIAEY
jgi:Flp pilus assembly protein TadG